MFFASRRNRPAYAIATIVLLTFTVAFEAAAHPRDPAPREAGSPGASLSSDGALKLPAPRTPGVTRSPDEYVVLGRANRSAGTISGRLRAQRVLEEGLRKYPDHPDILVELGRTYYEQTFYGDAERLFVRVLSIDPERCEPHYYLGVNAYRKWKHVQQYTDRLVVAADHLERAVACASVESDAFFKLAFSRYVLGDTARATEACEMFRRKHPDAPEPLLLLGCVAYERADYPAAMGFFRSGIALLPEEDQVRYGDVRALLSTDDERERYDDASREERRTYERLHWLAHDRDPTTEVNERFLEHLWRVFIADQRFGSQTPLLRGWETDRGKALIKFGWPDRVRTTLAGAKPWDGWAETWTYLRVPDAFDLCFRDEYLNGNYMVPLDDEISAAALHAGRPLTEVLPEGPALPGSVDVVTFRDPDDSSSVYVTFTADRDSLEKRLWTWDIRSFVVRAGFFEEDGRAYARYSDTLAVDSLPELAAHGGRSVRVVTRYRLRLNSYRLALWFQDERALARSLVWSDANMVRYLSNSLVLSDILFHTAPPTPLGSPIERRGKAFFPRTGRSFAPHEKLQLYVELYNLGLSNHTSRYEVTLSIHAADTTSSRWETIGRGIKRVLRRATERPAIAQTFRRTGMADVEGEDLAIDIDALEPGDYVLSVSVVDDVSKNRARISKPFTKLGGTVD